MPAGCTTSLAEFRPPRAGGVSSCAGGVHSGCAHCAHERSWQAHKCRKLCACPLAADVCGPAMYLRPCVQRGARTKIVWPARAQAIAHLPHHQFTFHYSSALHSTSCPLCGTFPDPCSPRPSGLPATPFRVPPHKKCKGCQDFKLFKECCAPQVQC